MKKTSLTAIIILLTAIFCLGNLSAQSTIKNSFVIQGPGISAEKAEFYKKSIEAANFEQFRLKTQSVILKFKNGFMLELVSAKELFANNLIQSSDMVKYSDYPATPNYKYPLFEILESGWVTAGVETDSPKK